MQNQNQEILSIIVLSALLALLLIGFIVTMLFIYQKKQHQHKKELVVMEEEYNQQILRVQFEIQEAVLAEISNKLHDALKNNIISIASSISAISMKLEKKLISIEAVTKDLKSLSADLMIVKEEIRLTSHSLSTDRISQVGLIDAIKFEIKKIIKDHSIIINSNINESANYFFKQEESVYLFRIFQESIGNILAHAHATEINILINLENQNIFLLKISDNGIGFNFSEKTKNKLAGIGLSGMQKRALQIGANFKLNSQPNIGTIIQIELPLTLSSKNNLKVQHEPKAKYSFN